MGTKALSDCLKGINECIQKTEQDHVFVEGDQFDKVTGYDLEYLHGILNAINAQKDKKNDVDRKTQSIKKIKKQRFLSSNSNSSTNERKRAYPQVEVKDTFNALMQRRKKRKFHGGPNFNGPFD